MTPPRRSAPGRGVDQAGYVTPSPRADAFDGAPAALCEAYRVLRPDGLFAVSAPRTGLTDRALAA